ncbi:glycosyltransferase family 2 protein [Microvirga mediterraneensis]|uniref:Glycosyltransferase family 2 protein n=1 Tax=Microvirga mediterraneensis TaxID=2754695 RepID=A0A838BQX7_9HYPH|nr:glycosyltransferase family 2 protein [Microvirga mediterraneensis]MBA1158174.1 glycosyltransferase family 2 protein [Microvirga mediterraneensis]
MNSITQATRPVLTILCPCFNEQGVVSAFFDQLRPVIESVSDRYHVKTIFLNNGSTDGTLDEILGLRMKWPDIYVITFSKNVGYQRSLDSGLRNTISDLYLFIDVDCEDPPALIPVFLEKYEQGYDIIYGERIDREEPEALKSARRYFYRLLKRLADDEILLDMAEFGMFTAEVRDAIISDQNSFPFIRSSISRVGFRRCGIPFKRQRRIGGQTHYNIMGMVIFAVAGILSASTLFLRLPIYILPFWILVLTGLMIAFLQTGAYWTAIVGLYVFAIYVGTALAFVSLYVARSYKNGLQRPSAFINRRDTYLEPAVAKANA